MSTKLALSAALSILMMSAFVLFNKDSAGAASHGGEWLSEVSVTLPALPSMRRFLPY